MWLGQGEEKVLSGLRNHENAWGGHFKHWGRSPAGSAHFLCSGHSMQTWLVSAGPPSDRPEVIRFRIITLCLEEDQAAWGEACVCVCVRWCYKMELIESEILLGLKWDPLASLMLRFRQRAANMTEFIKCVIKELKLSVAEHHRARSQVCIC